MRNMPIIAMVSGLRRLNIPERPILVLYGIWISLLICGYLPWFTSPDGMEKSKVFVGILTLWCPLMMLIKSWACRQHADFQKFPLHGILRSLLKIGYYPILHTNGFPA